MVKRLVWRAIPVVLLGYALYVAATHGQTAVAVVLGVLTAASAALFAVTLWAVVVVRRRHAAR